MPTQSLPRAKAGVGIHDFSLLCAAKSWMPAFAGMTMLGQPVSQFFSPVGMRRLVSR
jgi:hypothetical protein